MSQCQAPSAPGPARGGQVTSWLPRISALLPVAMHTQVVPDKRVREGPAWLGMPWLKRLVA